MSEQSPSPAEQRANAVAKLKRAASLPRMKNGRRPPLNAEGGSEGEKGKTDGEDQDNSGGEKSNGKLEADENVGDEAVHAPPESQSEADQAKDTGTESEKAKESETDKENQKEKSGSAKKRGRPRSRSRSRSRGSRDFKDLRPSDSSGPDEHAPPIPMYSPLPSSMSSPMASPFPMLAQPLAYFSSPSPLHFLPPTNPPTPTPLPSFEALIMRSNLMRSNSAAARMKTMQILTGGRETPDPNLFSGSPSPEPMLSSKLARSKTVAGGERSELRMHMMKLVGKRVNQVDPMEDQMNGGDDVVLTTQIQEASRAPSRADSIRRRSPSTSNAAVVDDREPPFTAPSTPAISLSIFPPLPPPPSDSYLSLPPRPTSPASSTAERERDSALAKLEGEDLFEYDAPLRTSGGGVSVNRGVVVEDDEVDDIPLTPHYSQNLPPPPSTPPPPSREVRIPYSSDAPSVTSSVSTSTSVPIYLHEEGQKSPYKEDAFPVTISPYGTPVREKPSPTRDEEEEEEEGEENERVVYQEDMGPRKAWLERFEKDAEWNFAEVSTVQPLHNGLVDDGEEEEEDDILPPPPPPKDFPPVLPPPSNPRDSSHPSTSDVNSPSPGTRRIALSPSPSSAVALSQSASTRSTNPNGDQRTSTASSTSAVMVPSASNSISIDTSTLPHQHTDRSRSQSISLTDFEDVQTDREVDRSREKDRGLKKESSSIWQKAKETLTGRRSRSNSFVSKREEKVDAAMRESSASGVSASSGGATGGGHTLRSPSTVSLAQIQSQMLSSPVGSSSILTVTSPPPIDGISPVPPVSQFDMGRYQNLKLTPFPGIVKLEEERRTRTRGQSISGLGPDGMTPTTQTGGGTVPSTRRNSPEPGRGLSHQASDTRLLLKFQYHSGSHSSSLATSPSILNFRSVPMRQESNDRPEYLDLSPNSTSGKLPTTPGEVKKWLTLRGTNPKPRPNGISPSVETITVKANGHPRGASLSDLLNRKDNDSGTEKEDLSRSQSHSGYSYSRNIPFKGSLKVRAEREKSDPAAPVILDSSVDPFATPPLYHQSPSEYPNGSAIEPEKAENKPWDDSSTSPSGSPIGVGFIFPSSNSASASVFASNSMLMDSAGESHTSSTASAIPASTPTTPSGDSSTSTQSGGGTPTSSRQILDQLDSIINTPPLDPSRSSILDTPPRKLLFSTPVKNVHSPTEVRNRWLFIFNDILVLAKPLDDESGKHWSDRLFSVKNIIQLGMAQLEIPHDLRDSSDFAQVPIIKQFTREFNISPDEAISRFYDATSVKEDPSTTGSLLFEAVGLSKMKLGQFLSRRSSKPILKAFVDKFAFAGVRIDEALRAFLLSMRLPTDSSHDMEHLLVMFSSRWYEANKDAVLYDKDFALRFVLAMMQLNDALHFESHSQSTVAHGLFSFPNLAISALDFIHALRSRDPTHAMSDRTLNDIYNSIADEELLQAAAGKTVPVTISPSLPDKLTIMTPSVFTVKIDHADPHFRIDLVGQDLAFEPKTLEFSRSSEASFRVTGSTLGQKTMLLVRKGYSAPLYTGLPLSKEFHVVRSFMQDAFILHFRNGEGTKRKYMMHVPEPMAYKSCCTILRTQITLSRREFPSSPSSPSASSISGKLKRAADAVALQVLRDSLITPDEPFPKGMLIPALSGKGFPLTPSFSMKGQHSRTDSSFQPHYPRSHSPSVPVEAHRSGPTTGHDLHLICQQNSLIPLVLAYLQVIRPLEAEPAGVGGPLSEPLGNWIGTRI